VLGGTLGLAMIMWALGSGRSVTPPVLGRGAGCFYSVDRCVHADHLVYDGGTGASRAADGGAN